MTPLDILIDQCDLMVSFTFVISFPYLFPEWYFFLNWILLGAETSKEPAAAPALAALAAAAADVSLGSNASPIVAASNGRRLL